MSHSTTIIASLLVPLIGMLGLVLVGRWPNIREAVTLVTATCLFLLVASLWEPVMAGLRPSVTLFEVLPGLNIAFEVEPLGLIFALIASFLWIVTSIYAIGYMRGHHEKNQTRFYAWFAVALSSTMGIAFAGNMFTLFIFYEVLTLSTYPLVTHSGTAEAKKGGRTYFGILIGTSVAFQLLAVIITWFTAGTLDFEVGGILTGKASEITISILLLLYVFGVGKAAIMPFHRWLPAAMVAPTPVSALLHAVAVVKAGVFTVLKVSVYIFGLDLLTDVGAREFLMWLAAATILISSVIAIRQDNLKRRLAYSTISQLSYIILGAMLATEAGIVGGAMHIAMHAFGKITLFFCAGAILVATHKTEISQMDGLGRSMPITMTAYTIGALSIIGAPPMGGLWSKWMLGMAALDAGEMAMIGVLMLSSLLSIGYLMPVTIKAFFNTPDPQTTGKVVFKEAPAFSVAALSFTALACIVLFLFPDPLYDLASLIVTRGN
jgi:multicomponent Na+:H+ antiporter subunit D